MKIAPNDLLLFARVVDAGSFSRAAEALDIPKSTLSRRMVALETQLGERLLMRTTRKLTVTDFGHAVLAHAHQVSHEVEATLALTQHRQSEPSGKLRISIPGDFANDVIGLLIADFIARYRALSIEVDISPRRVDLIGENFDLAIRIGNLSDDPSLTARRVALFGVGLYAAPAYLQRRGTPAEPEALMEHDTLNLPGRSGEAASWHLTRGEQEWRGLPLPRVLANSPALLFRLALVGAGIALLADYTTEPYVQRGELVKVLPDWHLPAVTAWAVFPGRRLMPARTRVFLDALEQQFSGPGCQQIEAKAYRGF